MDCGGQIIDGVIQPTQYCGATAEGQLDRAHVGDSVADGMFTSEGF